MALSKKQQLFVNEYLQSFNATRAAIAAGYSKKTAYANGWEVLRKPEVAEVVSKRLAETAMSADEILMRLAEQARGEQSKYVLSDGTVDMESLIEDGKGHLIKRVKQLKNGPDIEFYDSQSALALLAKHHNLFVQQVNQRNTNIEVDISSLTDEQLKRLAAGEDIASVMVGE